MSPIKRKGVTKGEMVKVIKDKTVKNFDINALQTNRGGVEILQLLRAAMTVSSSISPIISGCLIIVCTLTGINRTLRRDSVGCTLGASCARSH